MAAVSVLCFCACVCLLAEVHRSAGQSFAVTGRRSHIRTCSRLIISATLKPGSSRYLLPDDFVYLTRCMAQSTAYAKTYSSIHVFSNAYSYFVFLCLQWPPVQRPVRDSAPVCRHLCSPPPALHFSSNYTIRLLCESQYFQWLINVTEISLACSLVIFVEPC